QIILAGYMQPLGEDQEMTSFLLIEYPVGCWYCEMPEVTGIVFVELAPGKTASFTRGLVKVVGELSLNANDPESFLYAIRKAKVTEADRRRPTLTIGTQAHAPALTEGGRG